MNEVNFCIFSNANKVDVSEILDSCSALQQVVLEPTRKDEILDMLITDLHTHYHSPLPLPPLRVDEDKIGKDSDHRIILFPLSLKI